MDKYIGRGFTRQWDNMDWSQSQQKTIVQEVLDNMSDQKRLRRVQVFLVDNNENLEPKDAVLHQSEPFFTRSSDDELKFTVNAPELLEKHNLKRITVRDRSFRDKEVMLEKISLSDLQFRVVELPF